MLRSVKYGLNGAVLAGLIAAPVVWNTVDKSVHLVVDGKRTTIHTTASDVGGVLSGHGLRVSGHDLVAPSVTSHVRDGMDVVVRRGRLLQLNVDGHRANVWTTAPTVAVALTQLGYSSDNFVSVSRSRRLPLNPTAIAIRSPQSITVVHDGRRDAISTTSSTVGAVLADLKLTVGPQDRVAPAVEAPIAKGQTIRLLRVRTKNVVKSTGVRFRVKKVKNAKAAFGTTTILNRGRAGRIDTTYSVVYVDGKAVGSTLLGARQVRAPRTQVVGLGTKFLLKGETGVAAYKVRAQAIAARLLFKRGWGTQSEFDCLIQMWNRESEWRTDAMNPNGGAYGIPQALPGSKLATAGPNWQTDPQTQITWGLNYIAARYQTPCGAWGWWQAHNWY